MMLNTILSGNEQSVSSDQYEHEHNNGRSVVFDSSGSEEMEASKDGKVNYCVYDDESLITLGNLGKGSVLCLESPDKSNAPYPMVLRHSAGRVGGLYLPSQIPSSCRQGMCNSESVYASTQETTLSSNQSTAFTSVNKAKTGAEIADDTKIECSGQFYNAGRTFQLCSDETKGVAIDGEVKRLIPDVSTSASSTEHNGVLPTADFTSSMFIPSSHQSPVGSTTKSSFTGSPYEEGSRRVSCMILSEEYLVPLPKTDLGVKYVEVPIVEQSVRRIPKREVVDVERIVTKYEVEYVDKVVTKPCIQYIDKPVEKIVYEDSVGRTTTIIDVPREVVTKVPRIETVLVEKIVSVPGGTIEVSCGVGRGKKTYRDVETPVVVAQTVRQTVTEAPEIRDLVTYSYEPEIINIDIPVPRFIQTLSSEPSRSHVYQRVEIPSVHYNHILRSLNSHLSEIDLPYIKDGEQILILGQHELPGFTFPVVGVPIIGNNVPEQRRSSALSRSSKLSGKLTIVPAMTSAKRNMNSQSRHSKQHGVSSSNTGKSLQGADVRMSSSRSCKVSLVNSGAAVLNQDGRKSEKAVIPRKGRSRVASSRKSLRLKQTGCPKRSTCCISVS